MSEDRPGRGSRKKRLRCGFSTGTAAVAAAMAALRGIMTGTAPRSIAVRLPSGIYLPVAIAESSVEAGAARVSVIKDGGDDPDITHRAAIGVRVRVLPAASGVAGGVRLVAGPGVGVVTRRGLPVPPGEPAINPVPRRMFADNLCRELEESGVQAVLQKTSGTRENGGRPSAFVAFDPPCVREAAGVVVEVTVEVPKGEELAVHTLNPRLGIVGGISILGTTGIVKPFSNEAYEETIRAALSVAASGGCGTVVLSTGGKSERFAMEVLPDLQAEAFVQVADFFAFAVREARRFGFRRIVHSVFFGKAVKMAQGMEYTHARSGPLDVELLAQIARDRGREDTLCRELASANTARHALEIIEEHGASEIVAAVAAMAVERSVRVAGGDADVRLLLFGYGGGLLADVGS